MAARRRLPAALLLLCTALADDATVSVLLDINGAKQPLIIPTSGAVDATVADSRPGISSTVAWAARTAPASRTH